MDMKKILQSLDNAASKPVAGVNDMKRFVSVISESQRPLNRLTTAESMAVNHFTPKKKPGITSPVLNVAEGAKPSMIGKYFKTVETELAESAGRVNERATQLAEVVAKKVNETARKSAQVKLQQAWEREQQKSAASYKRGQEYMNQIKQDVAKKHDAEKKQGVAEGSSTMWEVSFDYGPHMSETVKVKAGSEEEAIAKVEKAAEKRGRSIMVNWAKPAKQGVAESEGDPEGVPHITKELLTHIVQQSRKEGAHAVVKSLEWGDGASKELLQLIIQDLKKHIVSDADLAEACWKDYKQIGMKKKGGKTVPNCVPK